MSRLCPIFGSATGGADPGDSQAEKHAAELWVAHSRALRVAPELMAAGGGEKDGGQGEERRWSCDGREETDRKNLDSHHGKHWASQNYHRKYSFSKITTYNIDILISLPFYLFYSLIIFFPFFRLLK